MNKAVPKLELPGWFQTAFQCNPNGGGVSDLVQTPPVLEVKRECRTFQDVYKLFKALDFKTYTSILINPKPEYVEGLDEYEIKEAIEKDIKRIMKNVNKYMHVKFGVSKDIEFKPQIYMIGEHGKTGQFKLHYHGIIGNIPNDVIKQFRDRMVRCVGKTDISYIKNDDAYLKYMFKSYYQAEQTHMNETWAWHSYILINEII